MQLPATLSLQPSRSLVVGLALAHLLAAAGLLVTDLPIAVRMLALPLLALSLAVSVRRASYAALSLASDGRLELICHDGSVVECAVDDSTTVLPWLVVLRLRTPRGVASLTLPVDALGTDGHRRLRLWLRWKATCETA